MIMSLYRSRVSQVTVDDEGVSAKQQLKKNTLKPQLKTINGCNLREEAAK